MCRALLIICLAVLCDPATAFAQSADTADTARTIGESGFVLDLILIENDCADAEHDAIISNEIVVCAQIQDQRDYVLKSREEARNDYAASTMDVGNPQAPDLSPPPACRA